MNEKSYLFLFLGSYGGAVLSLMAATSVSVEAGTVLLGMGVLGWSIVSAGFVIPFIYGAYKLSDIYSKKK